MLLRRVIEHVRDQNWTAVAIDFVIVVVGVFVGIQVANWNEDRADRTREAVVLAGLAKDMRGDIAKIDEVMRVSSHRMSALGWLIENAGGAPLPDGFESARGRVTVEPSPPYSPDDPKTIGFALFILTTLDGNRLAYDTMINTGGIGIIRDGALVREIQDYYASVDRMRTFETDLRANREALVDAQQRAGLSPVDSMAAERIAAAFAADPALLAAAKNYWLYTNRHLRLMRELREDAEQTIARIEGSQAVAP
jgi:hypothetical protein